MGTRKSLASLSTSTIMSSNQRLPIVPVKSTLKLSWSAPEVFNTFTQIDSLRYAYAESSIAHCSAKRRGCSRVDLRVVWLR